MSETSRSTAYDELLQAFKDAVIHALHTGRLSPICADFDVALIYAIGCIARATRTGSRADGALREACWAFGQFAVHQAYVEDDPSASEDDFWQLLPISGQANSGRRVDNSVHEHGVSGTAEPTAATGMA